MKSYSLKGRLDDSLKIIPDNAPSFSKNLEIAVYTKLDSWIKNRMFDEFGNFDAEYFFKEKGISINTLDTYDDFKKCDYIIFLEIAHPFKDPVFIECIKHNLENKLIYFAYEPELHNEHHSLSGLKNLANYFKYIFTWNDDVVDNKTFFKFNYCCNFDLFPCVLEAKNRNKLLTSISSNAVSSDPKELYSKRREVIDFFENNFSDDYDFYGMGWDKTLFKNCHGIIESKYQLIQSSRTKSKYDVFINYKFAVCFENIRVKGYISEKILDSLIAGTVPIYLGAPNIAEYIPSNCFIDYAQFGSVREMYDFIKNMDESTYDNYINNINSFLNSDLIKPFTWENFHVNLYKLIEYDQNNPETFKIKAYKKFRILFLYTLRTIERNIRKIRKNMKKNRPR